MPETTRLELPLLAASQAQKHVTVNEALARLDALVQLTLVSRTVTTPPGAPADGDCYAVPEAAVEAWTGQAGRLALAINGGWAFLDPGTGWRAWIADEGGPALFDGMAWVAGTGAVSPSGAALVTRVVEIDHAVAAGASSTTVPVIPADALVFAVTGRVTAALTGSAASWRLGVAGSDDRYGSGLGLGAGSWARGLTGSPLAYYAATPLVLTAEGGTFDGGSVRLAVHLAEFGLPRP